MFTVNISKFTYIISLIYILVNIMYVNLRTKSTEYCFWGCTSSLRHVSGRESSASVCLTVHYANISSGKPIVVIQYGLRCCYFTPIFLFKGFLLGLMAYFYMFLSNGSYPVKGTVCSRPRNSRFLHRGILNASIEVSCIGRFTIW